MVSINQKLQSTLAHIIELKDRLKEVIIPTQTTKPPFADVLQSIVENGELHKEYGKIRDVNMVVKVLNFMQENNITKVSELREKVLENMNRHNTIREQLKTHEILKCADVLIRELKISPKQSQQKSIRSRDIER